MKAALARKKYLVVVNKEIVLKTDDFKEALKALNKYAKAKNKYTDLINTTIDL